MKIRDIRASAHAVRDAIGHHEPFDFVFCEIETDEGLSGISVTGGFLVHAVVAALRQHFRPLLLGMDPQDQEAIHERVWWKLNPRSMTGVVSSALSCVDIAIWDICGKAAGRSIASLLGGARKRIEAYVTFGLHKYDEDELVDAAKTQVASGFTKLKLVVARRTGGWREDAQRIRAVRAAVGKEIDIIIDANYMFYPVEAKLLCRAVEDCNLLWFEEPLHQNDASELALLRAGTQIPIAAGQMDGHRWRIRELIDHSAVDILQPNACYCGGFSEARKAAHMAQAHNLPIANGGGWPLINMHLFAGLMNGWLVEWHLGQSEDVIFSNAPKPERGWLTIPDGPGLGLSVNRDMLNGSLVHAD